MPKIGNGKGLKGPKITDQTFSTLENPADDAYFGAVLADVKPSTSVWSILSGNDDAAFAIDPLTGELYAADGSAIGYKTDYKLEQTRSLVVQVIENGKKVYSATVKVMRIESSGMGSAVRQIGDSWSMLIVWSALQGTTRFDNFQSCLGVARNILSIRLSKLVDEGILVKRPVHSGARRLEYRVTGKGEALRPALELIEGWGIREANDRRSEDN